jgi:hypothetical protein
MAANVKAVAEGDLNRVHPGGAIHRMFWIGLAASVTIALLIHFAAANENVFAPGYTTYHAVGAGLHRPRHEPAQPRDSVSVHGGPLR